MEPFCPRSQQLLPAADAPCESCGAVTKDATAMVRGVGAITPVGRVGVVGESRFDDGREVIQYRAPSGAASDAVLDQGNVQLRISPPVDIGRPGEARVRQGMLAALRAEGREVSSGPAIDSAGEDFALSCDGRALAVQVVTVPSAPAFWQSVSQGSGQTNVSIAQAADWIFEAARAKSDRYSAAQKAGMVLAVDAAHAAVIVSPAVVDAYIARHGDPAAAFGFAGLCLVGPMDSRVTWVGTGRIWAGYARRPRVGNQQLLARSRSWLTRPAFPTLSATDPNGELAMPVGETLFDWVVGGRTICDRGEARLYALGEPAERSLTDQGRLTDLPPCRLEKPDNG